MYKQLAKPLLFRLSPEKAHHVTVGLLKLATKTPVVKQLIHKMYHSNHPELAQELMGLRFPNPVGLAAGFDKNGEFIEEMENLGFGFIEIGTVTPKGQPGNPQPRLFRLPKDEALINRMGFNNQGVEEMVQCLKNTKHKSIIIGGNIGKNKVTPNGQAAEDYLACFHALFDYVDYFAVNVSSPNTPNLRALQGKEPLTKLLSQLQDANANMPKAKPILLKIAPDLNDSQLQDIVEIVKETRLAGVIATNTTINRENLASPQHLKDEKGGLSGLPVQKRSTEVIRDLRAALGKNFIIIGVGGINSASQAVEKIEAGANLIQIYTGMVYEGPSLIKKINRAVLDLNRNS